MKRAPSTLNLMVSAWIFFYSKVLGRNVSELKAELPRSKKVKRKRRVYSKEEVRQIIYGSGISLKHQTFLSTVYHGGVRVSEACHLQAEDIQSANAVMLIRQGKGKKDRYTILPRRLLNERARRSLSCLSSLFDHNAVTHNPIKSVKLPTEGANVGKVQKLTRYGAKLA